MAQINDAMRPRPVLSVRISALLSLGITVWVAALTLTGLSERIFTSPLTLKPGPMAQALAWALVGISWLGVGFRAQAERSDKSGLVRWWPMIASGLLIFVGGCILGNIAPYITGELFIAALYAAALFVVLTMVNIVKRAA